MTGTLPAVRRWAATALALSVLLLGPGCFAIYSTPVRPPPGLVFSKYQAPVTTDFHNTPARPPKKGEADTVYFAVPILWRWDFAFKKAAIKEAARRGRIETVHYVDHEYFNVLGLFATYKAIVYGE
jgi:hypothetical protein